MDAAQFPAFGPASVGTFEAILSAVSAVLYLLIACRRAVEGPAGFACPAVPADRDHEPRAST